MCSCNTITKSFKNRRIWCESNGTFEIVRTPQNMGILKLPQALRCISRAILTFLERVGNNRVPATLLTSFIFVLI